VRSVPTDAPGVQPQRRRARRGSCGACGPHRRNRPAAHLTPATGSWAPLGPLGLLCDVQRAVPSHAALQQREDSSATGACCAAGLRAACCGAASAARPRRLRLPAAAELQAGSVRPTGALASSLSARSVPAGADCERPEQMALSRRAAAGAVPSAPATSEGASLSRVRGAFFLFSPGPRPSAAAARSEPAEARQR
jgi:hypothetical protein